MRVFSLGLISALALFAADPDPVTRVWRINPGAAAASANGLRDVLPEVHSVRVEGAFVTVESAGLALQSLAPLDVNAVEPPVGVRKFVYRFPLVPAPSGQVATPPGVVGAFVNGVPIYNVTSTVSIRDQNLWHQDAVAATRARSPIVTSLLERNGQHSPLIGFALDGYPVYGPWGWDERGTMRRWSSSYRKRAITTRDSLPDGTELGPSQEGPKVSSEFPAGTFVEDYEYVPGSGDLDEHNGRLAKTPDYPNGTYAYFLSTDTRGELMYPYLVGPRFHGQVPIADQTSGLISRKPLETDSAMTLATAGALRASEPQKLVFTVMDTRGRKVRFLEKVHEKPIHLLVVSKDLKDFAHIHPELQADDTFVVSHTFGHGGSFWLFADFTMPGKPQAIARFELQVQGPPRRPERLTTDRELTRTADGLRVTMRPPTLLRAGEDLTFRFEVADARKGAPVTDLEPYLGAWAHMMIVSADGRSFIHAHPLDERPSGAEDPWKHTHAAPGPSPSSVTTVTGFSAPGIYRMWVQFQRAGVVTAIPFTLQVRATSMVSRRDAAVGDAILVRVSKAGFEPGRISVPTGKPFRLAFERVDAENCAGTVVFPSVPLRRDLPAGRTTVVELPAMAYGELAFSCGMQMYRGAVVAR